MVDMKGRTRKQMSNILIDYKTVSNQRKQE